jgi:hypothetical protein
MLELHFSNSFFMFFVFIDEISLTSKYQFRNFMFLYRALWYNYLMLTNKMHTFKIKLLIQSFLSSACFEHHVFFIRKNILYMQFL